MEGFDFDPLDLTSVSVTCPHCSRQEADDFEVFDLGVPRSMRCDGCGHDYHFALMECPRCETESVFQWVQPPDEQALNGLACKGCGRRYAEAEAFVDNESPSR